jgi:excisionase family DNA binding protein
MYLSKAKQEHVMQQIAAAARFDGTRLSVEAVCLMAGICRTKVYELVKQGKLRPVAGLGRRCTRFCAADVKAYLANSQEAA